MKMYKPYYLLTVLASTIALTACGSGSGDGSGSGNRTTGAISAKSVNGINVAGSTFSTTSSSVSGDEAGSVAELDNGMVVSVESDGAGNAVDIEYDAEVEGVVQSIGGGMMVVLVRTLIFHKTQIFVVK